MGSVLKNVLRFTGLVVGVPQIQAHGLNYNGLARQPHNVWVGGGGLNVSANSLNVTVTRTPTGDTQADVAVELWHSIEDAEPLPGGISLAFLPFIMQGSSSSGSNNPNALQAINGDVAPLVVGAPVAIPATQFVRAVASSTLDLASAIGLVTSPATPGNIAEAQVIGVMTLTAAQWDIVTGQVGGLTPGAPYYVSLIVGMITTISPSTPGEFITQVGRAITSTVMLVDPSEPIFL